MLSLLGAHLLEDGAALGVMFRQTGEVPIQMPDDLMFSLGNEAETPFVAGQAGERADGK